MDVEVTDTGVIEESHVLGVDLVEGITVGGIIDGSPCSCRWSWCIVPRC